MVKKHLSSEVFYWDAPSRMLHKRDLFPLQVEIAGHLFQVPKWSIKYFKVADFPEALRSDKPFQVKLIIRFRNFNIQFETEATQLNYNSDNEELVARFESIPEEHRELLHYFAEALETGDMVNIDNVLRRVDMPVTPATTELSEVENKKSFHVKRFLFSTAYVLLGAALVAFSLSSLQKKLTEIETTSAFVSMPVVTVQSPYQGSIKEILVSKGNTIIAGQPLLSLFETDTSLQAKNSKLSDDIKKQEIEQALFKAEINKKKNSSTSTAILQRKLDVAQASLSAALSAKQVKCNRLYESESDRRTPHKRNAECNAANDKVTSAQIRVDLEKDQLRIGSNKLFQNNKSVRALESKLKRAQQDMEKQATQLVTPLGEKMLLGKVSGKIISLLNDDHQYLTKGQTIAVVQAENSHQYIDAYVTQEQAIELSVGNKARVSSATFEKTLAVSIVNIDYTVNTFEPSTKELFNWSVPKENTVKLTLKFINKPLNDLPLGLPVTLTIKKTKETEDSFFSRFLPKSFTSKKDKTASSTQNNQLFGVAYADGNVKSVTEVPTYCKSKLRLFPKNFIKSLRSVERSPKLLDISWKKYLLDKSDRNIDIKPSALKTLQSSGITDSKNKALKKTRKALRDAEITSLLSLSFLLTNDDNYLKAAKKLLLAWANTYQPDGHPINETRLEGFLWSYDLLRCYFTWEEQVTINTWLKKIQKKKHLWKFGPSSSLNNLKTHQLKMLLMLDNLLDDSQSLQADRESLQVHLINNLLEDGVSFDYKERDALHYHVYNLEPWLEISLLEPQYKESVNEAYAFLIKQIKAGNINNQFVNSKQKIDQKRAKGGFDYAKTGGSYKQEKITRSVIVHSTLNQLNLDEDSNAVNTYLTKKMITKNIFQLARHRFWNQ